MDEHLLNLAQVETIEIARLCEEEVELKDIETDMVDPILFELIAFLSSGREMVLYHHEDEHLV